MHISPIFYIIAGLIVVATLISLIALELDNCKWRKATKMAKNSAPREWDIIKVARTLQSHFGDICSELIHQQGWNKIQPIIVKDYYITVPYPIQGAYGDKVSWFYRYAKDIVAQLQTDMPVAMVRWAKDGWVDYEASVYVLHFRVYHIDPKGGRR